MEFILAKAGAGRTATAGSGGCQDIRGEEDIGFDFSNDSFEKLARLGIDVISTLKEINQI